MASETDFSVYWLGRWAVLTLPGEIDVTNSPGLRETLLAVISQQPAEVIVDMTATTFCDSSAMAAIVHAYRQALAAGAGMRLVIKHPGARRVFELAGIGTVIGVYPDLPAALSELPIPSADAR